MPDHLAQPEPKAVAEADQKQWLEDNREAMDFWNDQIDRNGLPLDGFRPF